MKLNINFIERDKGKHRNAWKIWDRKYGNIIDFFEWFYGVETNSYWKNIRRFVKLESYNIRLQKTHSGRCPLYSKYRNTGLKVCKKINWWELVRDGDFAHSQSSVKRKSRNRRYEHHTFRQKLKKDTKKYERDDVKIKIIGLALCYELTENERTDLIDSNLRESEIIIELKEKYPDLDMWNKEKPELFIHQLNLNNILEYVSKYSSN